MSLKYSIQNDPAKGETRVSLEGDISEHSGADFRKIVDQLSQPSIVFELAGVRSLNSVGVIEWTKFLEAIPAGKAYVFSQASDPFVNYANLVPRIMGAGKIQSLCIPYQCETCGAKHRVVAECKDLMDVKQFDTIKCGSCGLDSESQVDADDFLSFLHY